MHTSVYTKWTALQVGQRSHGEKHVYLRYMIAVNWTMSSSVKTLDLLHWVRHNINISAQGRLSKPCTVSINKSVRI